MIKKTLFAITVLFLLTLSSCYNDKAELLATTTDCDTTKVTFSLSISTIIRTNCEACHSGGTPSGNISLSNYAEISSAADNGSLMNTIRHESGWSAMPKGGNKLSDCDIRKLEIWINKGKPNN